MAADKPAGDKGSHGAKAGRLPRHGAFYLASVIGLAAGVAAYLAAPIFAIAIGANVMFAVYLLAVFIRLPALTPEYLRSRADEADAPVIVIFMVVVAVMAVSFFTLFTALNGEGAPAALEVTLSIVSVLLGWFVVHTMAALHYAYEYYESPSASSDKQSTGKSVGGLKFPEGDQPDGLAFLYFSYVLGTAVAVSDVSVTSNKMRAMVMVHSTFAFFFNTLIVAATVNVAVAVGNA